MKAHPSIDILSGYLDGALSDKEKTKLEKHLAMCQKCRRTLQLLKAPSRFCHPSEEDISSVTQNVMKKARPRQWNTASPILGEIREVMGTVLIRRGEDAEAIVAFPGCAVREGDRLQPVRDGYAIVEWEGAGRSRIEEEIDVDEESIKSLPRKTKHTVGRNIIQRLRPKRISLTFLMTVCVAVIVAALIPHLIQQNYLKETAERLTVPEAVSGDKDAMHLGYGVMSDRKEQEKITIGDVETSEKKMSLARQKKRLPEVEASTREELAEITKKIPGTKKELRRSDKVIEWYNPSNGTMSEGNVYRVKQKGIFAERSTNIDGAFLSDRAGEQRYEEFVNVWSMANFRPDKDLQTFSELDLSGERSLYYDSTFNTEAYDHTIENPFLEVAQNPLSTFSIDVDTASYSNLRRFLNQNQIPPPGAVRIEELINYFSYDYALPEGDAPFSVNVEIAACPWKIQHRLARIGLKGKEIPWNERPRSNLVFLLDVSGSMNRPEKLPLVKRSMKMLIENLDEGDRIAIVVYAGASGLVMPSTPCSDASVILEALDRLNAGGSTNGGEGIKLAFRTAEAHFIKDGINRVILATDGDFNVGITNQSDLTGLIEEKAKSGIFLTVLGFGIGNYKDSTLEKLADKGNGNYAYIDTINEARKALVEEIHSTLITIAKDVKIQVEFNPAEVSAYRLIGYENRMLRKEDFNDDTKDAGEIGAGHTVTALYELVPAGENISTPPVDPLKYQQPGTQLTSAAGNGEMFTLKLRYKEPDEDTSKLLEYPIVDEYLTLDESSEDFKFAAAVAAFGMILRNSQHKSDATFESAIELAERGLGPDFWSYRVEFIDLVHKARALSRSESE